MSIQPARKKRRLSPPGLISSHGTPSPPPALSDGDGDGILGHSFARNAANWDLEQDYEKHPRKQKENESTRLPIKTADGRIQRVEAPLTVDASSADESTEEEVENGRQPEAELAAGTELSPREQVIQAKEELARVAGYINENPEEHLGSLKTLAEITASTNTTITKLGLATQLTVFKDLIPGYRIRPISEEDVSTKVSKEVRKLRNFEQSIVGNYHRYVKDLVRIAGLGKNQATKDAASLSSVAVSCAGNLLNAVPHFNFRGDLVRILVDKLGTKAETRDFVTSTESLQTLFADDDDGNASLEAVAMLSKMIKAKHYRVDEKVLNLFLHLRLLSEFSHKGSTTKIDKDDGGAQQGRGKQGKSKRVFRTKKERKVARENKSIEKELREADAVVGQEEREKNQAETLKMVFSIYFNILKARTPSLMGPVLEGLVKYAHLINQDFFGDVLEALKDLISASERPDEEDLDAAADANGAAAPETTDTPSRDTARESLLCVITAFALLQGQDGASAVSTLNLDLSFFISHLYRALPAIALNPDLELSARSLHLPDPHAGAGAAAGPGGDATRQPRRAKVDVQTTAVLLVRSLQAALLPANPRDAPPLRLAAFAKQTLAAALHVPERSCTALLGLMAQVLAVHRRKVAALWNTEERRGDGVFDPLRGSVEGSNPFAATVWEGELLRLHWAPAVREGVKGLEALLLE